jgi:hypothetical protein
MSMDAASEGRDTTALAVSIASWLRDEEAIRACGVNAALTVDRRSGRAASDTHG